METKRPVGAPKKEPTVKPNLRCRKDYWEALKAKHPGQVNQMFNKWVKDKLYEN